MPEVVIASWNVHSGVDGWGRPFDVVAGCRALDADILLIQETWISERGGSITGDIAQSLGYRVEEQVIAPGKMYAPPPSPGSRWGPVFRKHPQHGPRADKPNLSWRRRTTTAAGGADWVRGSLGVALLSRLETSRVEVWDLGRRLGDPTRRCAVAADIVLGGDGSHGPTSLLVVGTHLSHLRHGSPAQLVRLRKKLASRGGTDAPAVIAGDMNLPGMAVSALFPGWRRIVHGRTWPSWRPIAQPDHVLVTPFVSGRGEVVDIPGSDHYPVRAVLLPA